MTLTEMYGSALPLFFSFSSKKQAPGDSSKPFEEALIARLRSLTPIPDSSSSIPLSWICRAVDLLSLTLADATALISDPSLCGGSDLAALEFYLDSTVALLDACNAISAAANRLQRGRLVVRLALRLLSFCTSPNNRSRARSAISEWKAGAATPHRRSASDLLDRLRPKGLPRGRITAVRRVIYAVEAVSDLVTSCVLLVLEEKGDLVGRIRVSSELTWGAAYNEVTSAVSAKLQRAIVAAEVEEAEASLRTLAAVFDEEVGGGEITERLRMAIGTAEKVTEELTERLEDLTNAVNGLFRVALETRDAAMQCFRVGSPKYIAHGTWCEVSKVAASGRMLNICFMPEIFPKSLDLLVT
ncbi:UPF0496 protein 4 [Apostasia shenzhenica]|uniref:UPF0496 protein 4 n=1 Tax=Apostasia shenzhenica TaxID=1088818 RepID=A0A2H9ZTL8_9ASPA|nr:UPF0496 protein 4 [Apostasia shenzhenica]